MTPYTLADAETELRAALDGGDLETISAAVAKVDRLDRPAPAPLASSALWYAEQGIPVFALLPGRKKPHGRCDECRVEPKCPGPAKCGHDQCHGLLDATLDPDRIRRWWDASPRDNIGLATGHVFDAVDIDGPPGQASRAQRWDDVFATIDADALAKVLTPRPGGMHIWVPPTGDGNATHIVPAVDYRGIGGYVVAPPSEIAAGGPDDPGTYRFLGTPKLTVASKAA